MHDLGNDIQLILNTCTASAMKTPAQSHDASRSPTVPPPRPHTTPPLSPLALNIAREARFPSYSLDEEIEQLDNEYTEIESLVLETIKLRNVPHQTMLKWVQVLPMTLKPQFSELLRTQAKSLISASSVDELFMILSPYWNSLHPTLLEHLIKKLVDEKLNTRMKQYMESLRNFRMRTTLGDFVDKWT